MKGINKCHACRHGYNVKLLKNKSLINLICNYITTYIEMNIHIERYWDWCFTMITFIYSNKRHEGEGDLGETYILFSNTNAINSQKLGIGLLLQGWPILHCHNTFQVIKAANNSSV